MANQIHLRILKEDGTMVWNEWRRYHPDIKPNLNEADLRGVNLSGANLSKTSLRGADLTGAILKRAYLYNSNLTGATLKKARLQNANLSFCRLIKANLNGANLRKARLFKAKCSYASFFRAHLMETDLSRAFLNCVDLQNADLTGANLHKTDLTGANLNFAKLILATLIKTNLTSATLVETNLKNAILDSCSIYGISIWDVNLEGTRQENLYINQSHQARVSLDNIDVAQFIYLLLDNKKIRNIIDTITSQVVLILGRFTPERKRILDALKRELRNRNYSPVVFDFDVPDSRDVTETVTLLARMAKFIIADLTDPRSIPQELAFIIPRLPSVPVQPLLLSSQSEYGMYEHFEKFPWVLPIYQYTDEASLLQSLKENVIDPAEQKVFELKRRGHKYIVKPPLDTVATEKQVTDSEDISFES